MAGVDMSLVGLVLILSCLVLVGCKRGSQDVEPRDVVGAAGRQLSQESRAGQLIKGGEDAAPGEFPFYVSLRQFGVHVCGGALIKPNEVLTAAHCVDGSLRGTTHPTAVVGLVSMENTAEAEVFETCTQIIHRGWETGNLKGGFDIAVLILNGTSTASPAKVVATPDLSIGDKLIAAGFGRTNETAKRPDVLQKTENLEYVSNGDCGNAWGFPVAENLLCAKDPAGANVCQGDSGGPLISSDKQTLLGIVSSGSASCTDLGDQLPAVYTRVSEFLDFVETPEGIREDQPNCAAVNPEAVERPGSSETKSPGPPPRSSASRTSQDSAPAPTQTSPSGEPPSTNGSASELATAESILEELRAENIGAAADIMAAAVEQGNADRVTEAVETAINEGFRSEAGNAVVIALNSGVDAVALRPALEALRR